MHRWRHLARNLGRGAAALTVGLIGLMGVVAAVATAVEDSWLPPALYAGAMAVAWACGPLLVRFVGVVAPLLRWTGLLITALAVALGVLRGDAWAEGSPTEWAVFAVFYTVVVLHLTATVRLFSDPEVVRLQ